MSNMKDSTKDSKRAQNIRLKQQGLNPNKRNLNYAVQIL